MKSWQPASAAAAARTRASMLQRIRRYFEAASVLEVDIPALSAQAVSDTQIESFEIPRSEVSAEPLYLGTSPEFYMKRLLAAGYPDIYSICRVFRDGECGPQHQPEFTMVEWYRLSFGLRDIIADTIAVIQAALGADFFGGGEIRTQYRDCFQQAVGADPLTASIDELADRLGADTRLRQSIGDRRDDWLDLALATRVAPTFAKDRLTVLQHYPASQAALARLCPDDPDVADRFEVFYGAIELANGYVELTDAAEQRRRMQIDDAARRKRGRKRRPHDAALLAALESGLPDCAGVALGVERLHMLRDGSDDIRDVITFAFEASE